MDSMLCKHGVENFARGKRIFDSRPETQRESGLHLSHLLRDLSDPKLVVMLLQNAWPRQPGCGPRAQKLRGACAVRMVA